MTEVQRRDDIVYGTVEFRISFTKEEFEKAMGLTKKYGDRMDAGLSKDTPMADILQDLQMLMFRLEQDKANKVKE